MAFVGSIRVPSDKSLSHRAVLFASLAQGTSNLRDVLPSDDVLSSIGAMRSLGAAIQAEEGPHGLNAVVTGFAGEPLRNKVHEIDCGNSGTTTRLLLGIVAGLGVSAVLTGDESLSKRPMERVMKPLRAMGAQFESANGCLPVRVLPTNGLNAAHYDSPQASAQVKSACLLAGLQAQGVTSVTEPAKSRDHTELLLPAFGVPVEVEGLTAKVEGPAKLTAHDMTVPADPSSAAFIAVAAAVTPGSDVTIEQVALNPTRAGAFEVLKRMGANIVCENERMEGAEPVGDVHVCYKAEPLQGTTVTPEEIPTLIDEIPILAVAAAHAEGLTVFQHAGELRVKESDRFQAILDGLRALGVKSEGVGDDLHVHGVGGRVPLAFEQGEDSVEMPTYHDHRLAMTWHLEGMADDVNITLDDAECVSVSWPGFYADVAKLAHR